MVYINLSNAFGTVDRSSLWILLSRYGCPEIVVKIIQECHDGTLYGTLYCRHFIKTFPSVSPMLCLDNKTHIETTHILSKASLFQTRTGKSRTVPNTL